MENKTITLTPAEAKATAEAVKRQHEHWDWELRHAEAAPLDGDPRREEYIKTVRDLESVMKKLGK